MTSDDTNNLLDIPEFLRRNPTIKKATEAYEKTDTLDKEKDDQINEGTRNPTSFAA